MGVDPAAVRDSDSHLALELPEGPVAQSPDDHAIRVGVGQALRWVAPAGGGASFVILYPSGDEASPQLTIATTGNSVRIPDLSKLGISFASKTDLTWSPIQTRAAQTVDELAAQGVELGTAVGDRTYGWSKERQFTTP